MTKLVPIYEDNYVFIHQTSNNGVYIVDPGKASEVIAALDREQLSPTAILITHHHWDHITGIEEIKENFNIPVYANQADSHRIPHVDHLIEREGELKIGMDSIEVLFTPGHTTGHIAYHFPKEKSLFSGDSLFALGCGKLFEGSAEDLWSTFAKFKSLDQETKIYCTHEYTLANAEFCEKIDPQNSGRQKYIKSFHELREKNKPSIPILLSNEIEWNPFLDPKSIPMFSHLDSIEALRELRLLKDKG
ncbi:MAG: hydroxyacylglutathione hydrolase [Bdellovibrionales bacterium]